MTQDPKLAILMLCCRDYEAVELALACHMAYGDPKIPFFVLQNCKGDYDCERTLAALKRYEMLYPQVVRVIDPPAADYPYRAVAAALQSELLDYDYICKVDDDAFPIAAGWLAEMWRTYEAARARHGDKLAYVTPLLNNNCWGFPQVLKAMDLEKAYFAEAARPHRVGGEPVEGKRPLLPANEIDPAGFGTIWKAADIARWLHERTTLQPDRFIEATRGLGPVAVDNSERYSIGCMLFERKLWPAMDDGSTNDEEMVFTHCRDHSLEIVCARSVPFVHLTYYPQKEELRDVVRAARDLYAQRTKLRHPISGKASQLDELEARLRHLERRLGVSTAPARDGGLISLTPAARPAPAADVFADGRDEENESRKPAWESLEFVRAQMPRARCLARPRETLEYALSLAPTGGLALEFGVGHGRTLRVIAEARRDGRVWGFDSFKGLPDNWRKGYPAGYFATTTIPEVPGAEIVAGWFDQSLPPFLVENPDPVDFVHVDCDLYSSTVTVLKLLEHRLRPGTVLLFDEYFDYPGWQEHEHKAWMEFVERTGIKFGYECFTSRHQQVGVRLLK